MNCKEIGDWFSEITSIKEVIIGNGVTSIGNRAFKGCSGLRSVIIPNSVTNLGGGAFYRCTNLSSVTIPGSVTSLGVGAFYCCSSLKSITIPNSVTIIEESAFYDCSGLTSVTIGNSVTSIGFTAFYGCVGLVSIYLLNETPIDVNSWDFSFGNYDATLYVPQGSIEAYKAADVWKEFANIVEYDATAIEDVTDDAPAFELTAGGIQLTAAEGKAVAVYSVGGELVEKFDSYANEEIVLDKSVYILRVGGKAVKVKL